MQHGAPSSFSSTTHLQTEESRRKQINTCRMNLRFACLYVTKREEQSANATGVANVRSGVVEWLWKNLMSGPNVI